MRSALGWEEERASSSLEKGGTIFLPPRFVHLWAWLGAINHSSPPLPFSPPSLPRRRDYSSTNEPSFVLERGGIELLLSFFCLGRQTGREAGVQPAACMLYRVRACVRALPRADSQSPAAAVSLSDGLSWVPLPYVFVPPSFSLTISIPPPPPAVWLAGVGGIALADPASSSSQC